MATSSSKKITRVNPKSYSVCHLYNNEDMSKKLEGLLLANCNPSVLKTDVVDSTKETIKQDALQAVTQADVVPAVTRSDVHCITGTEVVQAITGSDVVKSFPGIDVVQIVPGTDVAQAVSDKMTCNFCDAVFLNRLEQKRHYHSDWHRYNVKMRLFGRERFSEQQFEDIAGNISSLSGSDSDTDTESDQDQFTGTKYLTSIRQKLLHGNGISTDSESDTGNQLEDISRRLPKVYFTNKDGELLSIYRCVICHKKCHPSNPKDLVSQARELTNKMSWAVLMAGGGHFAGAVFDRDKIVVHKTFHRYVVRAKRGMAQSTRDSHGNAPKSAGATLRRYNEAALTQEIQDLLASWNEHIRQCDRIFIRAPSLNRKIFFSGKNPLFEKGDTRIRPIPLQTRRPTFNEVRRVFEILSSVEFYGDGSEIQDQVPISPPQHFNTETGQLMLKDENQLTAKQRKYLGKLQGSSHVVNEITRAYGYAENHSIANNIIEHADDTLTSKPDYLVEDNQSSGTSSACDIELVETMACIDLMALKEYAFTKKPKRKKKARKRCNSLKCQNNPESDIQEEEKYHLKNSLYTACKMGDIDCLRNLLAIFNTTELAVGGGTIESVQTVTDDDICAYSRDKTADLSLKHENCQASQKNIGEIFDKSIDGDQISVAQCQLNDLKKETDEHFVNNSFSDNLDVSEAIGNLVQAGVNPITESSKCYGMAENKLNSTNRTLINLTEPCSTRAVSIQDLSPVVTLALLNETFGDNNTTLLHVAAREGHITTVTLLLESGANPCIRDKGGLTPYMVSKDKPTRNEFRRFRNKWPDRYDYGLAQISSALTEEMEAERKKKETERKKAQKKVKQEQQKARREMEEKESAEKREQQRFLSLSDREKRALAAEKRLISQMVGQGAVQPVLSRCFCCGQDMTGKVPFEYFDNKFCTSKCLQQHRKSQVKS